VILTGASGSGKSTLARAVEDCYPGEFEVLYFDSIGVPSSEEMKKWGDGYQPGGAWQRAMTLQWFEKLAPMLRGGRSVLFEGQMRLAFIQEALNASTILHAHVILLDCDVRIRSERLVTNRAQPDLSHQDMFAWADYLRAEALGGGYEILDTGNTGFSECVEHIVSRLRLLRV
jgi:energy-coupling factor transporter ATP-binding protein EcfA2